LSALRSIFSDLSNLLLSSVIIHSIRLLAAGTRAGGIVLALVVSLTAGLQISPSVGRAFSFR
jgi:hypothetical protein